MSVSKVAALRPAVVAGLEWVSALPALDPFWDETTMSSLTPPLTVRARPLGPMPERFGMTRAKGTDVSIFTSITRFASIDVTAIASPLEAGTAAQTAETFDMPVAMGELHTTTPLGFM